MLLLGYPAAASLASARVPNVTTLPGLRQRPAFFPVMTC